jgi:hypothetical protein
MSWRPTRPPESWPVAQVAPESFLGVALRNLERQGEDPSDNLTSSSSLTSESNLESDNSTMSACNPETEGRQHRQRQTRSKSKSRKEKSTLKSIPPRTYDGAADARLYHHFICESESYLWDGRVSGTWHRVFTLSHIWFLHPEGCYQWARLALATFLQGTLWLLLSHRLLNTN